MNAKKTFVFLIIISLMCAIALGLVACGPEGSKEVTLDPKLSADASGQLLKQGTLTVGVDISSPPFAANANNKTVGLDVDVASALTTELGVKLELVVVSSNDAEAALTQDKVDVVMNISKRPESGATTAAVGPYLQDGPAVFTVTQDGKQPNVTIESLKGKKIGVTSGSATSTIITKQFGVSNTEPYMQLNKLFEALSSGAIPYAASDIIPGAYLCSQMKGLVFAINIPDSKSGVFMLTDSKDKAINQALTEALKTINSNGILRTTVNKWVGDDAADFVVPALVTS